ncbi:MAG: DUF2062 domain-containing protein [Pseudomonadota bacterium]
MTTDTPRAEHGTEIGPEPRPGDHSEERRKKARGGLVRAAFAKFIQPFTASRNPPWFDARGAAVGLLLAFGFPVGSQMAAMIGLRCFMRFNFVIAFAVSWVSNPFFIVPQYYAYYYFGSLILGEPNIMTAQAFRDLLRPVLTGGYFWSSVQSFLSLSKDVVARWGVSAAIAGPTAAFIGYVVTYSAQTARRRREALE